MQIILKIVHLHLVSENKVTGFFWCICYILQMKRLMYLKDSLQQILVEKIV